jgi:hypothetical protein
MNTIEVILMSAIIVSAVGIGYSWRNIRAERAIRRLGILHRRNVAEAHQRGFREGVTSQIEIETQNARREYWN